MTTNSTNGNLLSQAGPFPLRDLVQAAQRLPSDGDKERCHRTAGAKHRCLQALISEKKHDRK